MRCIMVQISVIVPVFKVEPYLSRCIDSILRQSVQSFELILVDDGSPDRCGEICDEYAQKDARVRVIHQENRGVSAARNRGLAVATGKYVVFIDSDDWVKDDYLRDLLSADADFVSQSFAVYNEDGDFLKENCWKQCRYESSLDTVLTLLEAGVLGYTFSKRFTLKIIQDHEIQFNDHIDHTEDTLFIIDYLHYAKSIQIEDKSNYCYVRYDTRETLSGKATYERLAMASTANHVICKRFFPKGSEEYEKLYYSRIGYNYMSYVGNIWLANLDGVMQRYFFVSALLKNTDINKIIKYAPNALWKLPVHEKVIYALYNRSRLQLAYACLCDHLSRTRVKHAGN